MVKSFLALRNKAAGAILHVLDKSLELINKEEMVRCTYADCA
jgi:hypothetical protein